jgi:DNA-binding PadR family transcriptional regulator
VSKGDSSIHIDDEFEKWSKEIRRGAIALAILAIILEGESYGYDIMKRLSQDYPALQIEPSTIYPLLRRLEKGGLLEAEWSPISEKKGRRLYFLTKGGKKVVTDMVSSWLDLNEQLGAILKEAKLLD